MGEARSWHSRTVGKVGESWEALKKELCLTYFPLTRVVNLQIEVFTFTQKEGEPLGAAWSRFMKLVHYGPDLEIPELMMLQHFLRGLVPSAHTFLKLAAGGSFSHMSTAKAVEILDKVQVDTPDAETWREPPPPFEDPPEPSNMEEE